MKTQAFRNIHLFQADLDKATDAIVDFAADIGLVPMETEMEIPRSGSFLAVKNGEWISIFYTVRLALKKATAALSFLTQHPALGLDIHLPDAWDFLVAEQGDIIGAYNWCCDPGEIVEADRLRALERKRLENLGLGNMPKGANLLRELLKSGKKARIRSSDPYVELQYMKRIAGEEVERFAPELDAALPGKLAKVFPGKRAAGFRRILGKPHLSVEQMVAEFCGFMELEFVFESFDSMEILCRKKDFGFPCLIQRFGSPAQ